MRIKRYLTLYSAITALFLSLPPLAFSGLFPAPLINNDQAFIYLTSPVKQEKYINKKWGLPFLNDYSLHRYQRTKDSEGEKVIMIGENIDPETGIFITTLEFKAIGDSLQQTKFCKKLINWSEETVFSYEADFESMAHRFPADSYAFEIFPLLLKTLINNAASKFSFHFWASERTVIPMYVKAKIKTIKEVTVPAGTFNCYPIEVYPNVADFLNLGEYFNTIVHPFVPTFIFYFEVEPPHRFIHFKGPAGPPGSSEINLDLVRTVKGEKAIKDIRARLMSKEDPSFFIHNNNKGEK